MRMRKGPHPFSTSGQLPVPVEQIRLRVTGGGSVERVVCWFVGTVESERAQVGQGEFGWGALERKDQGWGQLSLLT